LSLLRRAALAAALALTVFPASALAITNGAQDLWIKLQSNVDGGVCFGDSGGPWLLDGAIAAIISGGSASCKGNSQAYRLDTPAVRAFLSGYVTLP
jgi:hypothetical protein